MATSNIKLNYWGIIGLVVASLILFVGYNRFLKPEKKIMLRELLSVSMDLAERGGAETVAVKKTHKLAAESKGKTQEGMNEMKTDGDMRSHRAIISGFAKAFPELADRIISEEHDKKKLDTGSTTEMPNLHHPDTVELGDEAIALSRITIWIDPLDATQEYTEDLDEFVTVMICVAVDGIPTLGIIRRPFTDNAETVWGWSGKQHSSNLKPVAANTPLTGDTRKVIVSRSHTGDGKTLLEEVFGTNVAITPAGGAGFKTIEVVRGTQDAYVHITRIKKWDICAGDALLRAVGGRMKTLENTEINYDKYDGAVVDSGLLATMSNFDVYMEKISPAYAKHKIMQKDQKN